jgi:predicted RNA methylase
MQRSLQEIKEDLLKLHASTVERSVDEHLLNNILCQNIVENGNVIDIGGGLFPLMFPWVQIKVKNYILIEKDQKACRVVELFAKAANLNCIKVINSSFEEVDYKSLAKGLDIERFDTALILKTVLILARQKMSLLFKLAKLPTEKMVITAPTKSLVKNHDIQRQEDKVLKDFISLAEGRVIQEFTFSSEFGYVFEQIQS